MSNGRLQHHVKVSKYYDLSRSDMRKGTDEIDILITSRNVDRKDDTIYQNNKWASFKNKEEKPAEPVQIKIYHSYTYRKGKLATF